MLPLKTCKMLKTVSFGVSRKEPKLRETGQASCPMGHARHSFIHNSEIRARTFFFLPCPSIQQAVCSTHTHTHGWPLCAHVRFRSAKHGMQDQPALSSLMDVPVAHFGASQANNCRCCDNRTDWGSQMSCCPAAPGQS